MIVMINGSFGVGKTTAAQELLKKIPDALLYDPEIMGFAVREITNGVRLAEEETSDFQDIAIWRPLVITTAEQLAKRYHRPLIVPMTLGNLTYLDEIRDGFRSFDPQIYHVCLTASLSTIRRRLAERGDGDKLWPLQKAIEYVPIFGDVRFSQHIDTEQQSPAEVVASILNYIGLPPTI